jgi:uncharacterized membrane protein
LGRNLELQEEFMDSLNQYTSQYPFIETVASIIVLLLVAFLANFLVKKVLLRIVDRLFDLPLNFHPAAIRASAVSVTP